MNKNCNTCSAKIEEGIRFCPHCGANQGKLELAASGTNLAEFVPTIEVSRELAFIGWLFSYRVMVDGVEVGKLRNGAKKRFPIAPGLHEMYIKEDRGLFCSPKVSFILRDFAKFSCRPQIGFFGALFGKIGFYLLFKRRKFIVLKDE